MGCQCTKNTENADLDTIPQPKIIPEIESRKEITSQKNDSAIDESKTQRKKVIKKKKKKEERSESKISIM
jgi:hypothetical protein